VAYAKSGATRKKNAAIQGTTTHSAAMVAGYAKSSATRKETTAVVELLCYNATNFFLDHNSLTACIASNDDSLHQNFRAYQCRRESKFCAEESRSGSPW